MTSRIDSEGSYNVLYGTDASVRLFGQDYITLNWAQSFENVKGVGGDSRLLDVDATTSQATGARDMGSGRCGRGAQPIRVLGGWQLLSEEPDRFSLDPIAPFSQERALLIKYSHTLTLGL